MSFTWNEEVTARLVEMVEGKDLVTQEDLKEIAVELETTNRSIGSKLRKMGYNVQKASEAQKSPWSPEEQEVLVEFLEVHEGEYTYGEIAGLILDGKFTDKQVQGKILSLEMTAKVKPTPRKEVQRSYTVAEEDTYVEMTEAGAFLEDIAEALGKELSSVRGKGLSLKREGRIVDVPKQKNVSKTAKPDPLAGVDVSGMTVDQIAEAVGKSTRGVKSMLSRRGLTCADYDGAARRSKLDSAEKDAE